MSMRIGFIGAGRMAHLHATFLHDEPEVEVVATCDNGSGRAHDFTRDYGAHAYSNYHTMLDQQTLDGVYICTPTATHASIGLECVERGIPFFIEKPLDLDLNAAGRLVRAAAGRRLLAVTALQWRYSPAFRRARELIGDEPIALVHLHWYWTRPPIQWIWDRAQAGGQIVDQNIHLIDLSRALAGEVTSVYAAYNQRQTNFEPDFVNWDGYALTLRYATGAVGTCAGTYALYPAIQERPTADFCLRDRMVRVTDRDVSHFTPSGVEKWENEEPLHRGINRAFIAALRAGDGAGLCTTLGEGLRSTAVALAANRSASTGHAVDMAQFMAEYTGDEEVGP